jgi:membrane-associated phospholipid phosphatase
VTYYFFQTTTPRPVVDGTDFLSSLVQIIYRNDEPFNCFPSIHVYTTSLMVVGILNSTFRNKWNVLVISIISILINLSTLFVKQHVILDVVSGVGLAILIYPIFDLIYKRWAQKQKSLFSSQYEQFERVPEQM